MLDPAQTHNHNVVFILGAGASFDAGMPLVSNFLNRMRDSVEWLETNGWKKERAAVQEVLRFRHQSAAAAYRVQTDVENIEELFSLAAATSGDMADHVNVAIAATLEFCRDEASRNGRRIGVEVREETGGWQPPPTWSDVMQPPGVVPTMMGGVRVPLKTTGTVRLAVPELIFLYLSGRAFPPDARRRVTIVTFNYDLVAETALDALGVPWHYGTIDEGRDEGSPPPDAVRLLKLHGSINWGRPQRPALLSPGSPYESYAHLREAADTPLLVPPTWQKSFVDAFALTWSDAVTALREATRVFILGFSIPASDTHFKYLLAAGLRDNISLRRIVFATKDLSGPEGRLRQILRPDLFDSIVLPYDMQILDFAVDSLARHLDIDQRLPIRVPR